jgi:peptide/nickel transport system substrate-binding protein
MREMKMMFRSFPVLVLVGVALALAACGGGGEEVTVEEAATQRAENRNALLAGVVEKPGPPDFQPGIVGGSWVGAINNDPKTFNELNARDGDTGTVISGLSDMLADYDPYTKTWIPNLCSFEIEADEANDSMRVVFTLRDDLYWTLPGMATREEGVKVPSDDVVFWYDEIEGDPELQQPGYAGQFIEMADGSDARVTIERIDDRRFAFVYPRIVANPLLSSNMSFGPRHVYQPAKEEGGVEGVLNLFSVDTDVTQIPSLGEYHIVEYSPGVRVVLNRNPHYWKTDDAGTSLPKKTPLPISEWGGWVGFRATAPPRKLRSDGGIPIRDL